MIKFIRSLFSRPKSTLIRFELLVKPSFVEKLEQLAEGFGTSEGVVIDCAIGLFAKALEEAEKGNIIDFVPDNPDQPELTCQEQENFANALINPPEPNEALKNAMIEYSENVSSEETPQVTSSYEHFKVKMSDQLAKQFDEIQQTTGLSGAEVFSRAISLYSIAKKAIENGEQFILKGEDKERELFNF